MNCKFPSVDPTLTVFDRRRRLQLFRLELGPGELQGLREEMEAPHVEQHLVQAAVIGTVEVRGAADGADEARRGLRDGRQRCRLVAGNTDDRVNLKIQIVPFRLARVR